MGRLFIAVTAALAAAALVPAGASAKYHECQHPVTTGAGVSHLHNITVAEACPGALKLFHWEVLGQHYADLFKCLPATTKDGIRTPKLKRHHFRGYTLSLGGKYNYAFRMAKDGGSFAVGGTDFPINCT
jgi:hypothetical protein